MSKIAVIKTGGKQYKVKEGEILKVEKLDAKPKSKVKFDTLMVASTDGKEVNIGKPFLAEKIEAEVIEEGKNKKVSVVKYKSKTRYLRNVGHRQAFTKVKIGKIQ
jgi:large subunit ribosomal protein L21